MIVFPGLLEEASREAGMKTPTEEQMEYLDSLEENETQQHRDIKEEFPHFAVFCATQLCRPLTHWGEHWNNAKIIALIPEDDIKRITFKQLTKLGFVGLE